MVFRGEHDRCCDQASLGPSRFYGRYPHQPSLQQSSTHSLGVLSPKICIGARGVTIQKGGLSMQAGL